MTTKITLSDEKGTYEYESDSDCITIIDDGNGNVQFVEDDYEEEDTHNCANCGRCIGYSYCVYYDDDEEW